MKEFLVRILGLAAIIGLLAYWNASDEPSPPPAAPPAEVVPVTSPARLEVHQEEQARAERAGREQDQAAAQAIAAKERDFALRAKAEARGKQERPAVAQRFTRPYAVFIRTNTPTYLALVERAKALAGKPNAEVRCTICSGDHYLRFCLLCRELNGKCRNCEGTGRIFVTEYCDWCIGSGKCFLCAGYGKMLCPFCDDGVIDPKLPPPGNELKVE